MVTVDTSGAPLAAGELYSYDLQFKVGSTTTTLKDEKLLENEGPTSRIADVDPMAPLHLALGFEKDRLPVVPRPTGDVRADHPADRGGRAAARPRQLPAARQRRRSTPSAASPRSSRTTTRARTSCT